MTKKKLLIVEFISVVLALFLAYIQSGEICYSKDWCRGLWDDINLLGEILLVIISAFPFLLITYRLKEEVFRAWWNFARWFVPVIIVASFFLNGAGGGGLGISGAVSGAFNFLILCIFYAVFILVSLIRIVLAYRRTR
jgi:hypothetical protein